MPTLFIPGTGLRAGVRAGAGLAPRRQAPRPRAASPAALSCLSLLRAARGATHLGSASLVTTMFLRCCSGGCGVGPPPTAALRLCLPRISHGGPSAGTPGSARGRGRRGGRARCGGCTERRGRRRVVSPGPSRGALRWPRTPCDSPVAGTVAAARRARAAPARARSLVRPRLFPLPWPWWVGRGPDCGVRACRACAGLSACELFRPPACAAPLPPSARPSPCVPVCCVPRSAEQRCLCVRCALQLLRSSVSAASAAGLHPPLRACAAFEAACRASLKLASPPPAPPVEPPPASCARWPCSPVCACSFPVRRDALLLLPVASGGPPPVPSRPAPPRSRCCCLAAPPSPLT